MSATLDAHKRLMQSFDLLRGIVMDGIPSADVRDIAAAALHSAMMAAIEYGAARHQSGLDHRPTSQWERAVRVAQHRMTPPAGTPVVNATGVVEMDLTDVEDAP